MQTKVARPRKERTENAARRRKQIVGATIESIVQHGLSGTTLATVATIADMSQGSAVFYFQSKDQLIAEAFRAHCSEYQDAWMTVFESRYDDPVEHLMAFMLVDFSKEMCNRREISLWFDFWGETQSRPQFRDINEQFSSARLKFLTELVDRTSRHLSSDVWTTPSLVEALEAITDGLWLQLHMSKGRIVRKGARMILAKFVAGVYPTYHDAIVAMAQRRA